MPGTRLEKQAPGGEHNDEPEAHEKLPTRVRLPVKVIAAAGIKTAPVKAEVLPATVDLSGEIAADPDRSARIAARVSGRIAEVRFKEGGRVKAGQVMAVIESPDLAHARAAYTAVSARAASARLNARRFKALADKALASGQEASAAEAEAASLEAEVTAARQTLAAFGPGLADALDASSRLAIRTPIAGAVLSRDAVIGQAVAADHVIANVGDLDRVYFLGRLFEKDLARIRAGARAEVRLNAYPREVFEGTVETVGKQLDPAARTVIARIALANHDDLLKVGLFGNARVAVGEDSRGTRRLVVPLSAITLLADRSVVFVHHADGDFEVHPVTLGRTAAGKAEVLTGLRENEQVVVEGAFSLKSAVLKSTFGEEE